jgi:hypothetical protein
MQRYTELGNGRKWPPRPPPRPRCASPTTTTALTDDVLALVVFKTGVSDPQGRLAAWTEDDDRPCSWPGVGCDARTGRVTSLSLPAASLSGRLPRALLRLDALLTLALPRNNLSKDDGDDSAFVPTYMFSQSFSR